MYLNGNKQEWSKIYALLRLMDKKELFQGDRFLQQKKAQPLALKRLERMIPGGKLTFYPQQENWKVVRELTDETTAVTSAEELSFAASRISETAEILLTLLKGEDESFECAEAENLLEEMGIYDYVSASEEGDDFQAVFQDPKLDCEQFHKIRVRSLFGHLYLVAANRASNFKYDITQVKLANPEAHKINAIGDNETGSIFRLGEVFRLGGKLKYATIEGKFFLNALQLIDMQMPKLLSEMVRLFYTTDKLTVKELTQELNQINLFKVKDEVIEKSRIYEYKVRQFLYAAACGLKPTKTWRGNGHTHLQLFIDRNGEMLWYDPVQKEEFEKFLLENTRLSLPNEDKNKFGVVEKENGQWLIKLNLEIRFK